jgi:replicative DNA helicase
LEALQRRFRKSRPASRPRPATTQPERAALSEDDFQPVPLNADTIAERWIIGAVLHEPDRWEQVQTVVSPSDFTAPLHRQFAEAIWNHLRDEGPIDLASFCGNWSEKRRIALLEIVEEVEQSQSLEAMLYGALEHVREQRQRREELALLMAVRQKQSSAEEEKTAEFEAFVKKHRPTDLRRIGPKH